VRSNRIAPITLSPVNACDRDDAAAHVVDQAEHLRFARIQALSSMP
jgi:hypothetical protein